MKIRTVSLWFSGPTLVLAVGTALAAFLLRSTFIEIEEAQDRRFSSILLADELHQSSDDLTRFARNYAATGDEKYERFFNQVLDIRNGVTPRPEGYGDIYWDFVVAGEEPEPVGTGDTMALETRILAQGLTVEEFNKLKEAHNRSDELARLEEVAMNAVKGRFDDGTGTFGIKREPDPQLAVNLLHGERYHKAKAAIMGPLRDFTRLVDERTATELERLNTESRNLLIVILLLTISLVGCVVAALIRIHQRLIPRTNRLLRMSEEIAHGRYGARSGVAGRDEIGVLAQGLDGMVEKLVQTIERANAAATEVETQKQALEEEHDRSERLLRNFLPELIAERLKKGEPTVAEAFPEVTIVFADLVGFTEVSAQLSSRELVSMLNEVFGRFDQLSERHKLEKIKTIGDCYMAVAGVPNRSPTHCQQVADFALDALDSFGEYRKGLAYPLEIRIGINTGTVIAGIVGTSKFSFDLWGDVVNIASRLESNGVPGRIQVSDGVHTRLSDDYLFEERGNIDIKGARNDTRVVSLGNQRRAAIFHITAPTEPPVPTEKDRPERGEGNSIVTPVLRAVG